MSVETLQDVIPETAKDLRLNISSMLRQTELNEQQVWGTVVSCAIATRSKTVQEHLLPEAKTKLSAEAYAAAESVAAIMGMNNIFYRFSHLTTNEKYRSMPARLRMNGLRGHGIAQKDVELWSLAVSAINGCAVCVDSHEKVLRENEVSEESIMASVRIAAVLNGLATVLA